MQVRETNVTMDDLRAAVSKYWGYDRFRPLQEKAMNAVLAGRDSLVVLPTGGGKSLCYQAPAVARGETTVVVSPLISLMKDQVDSLKACGIAAVQIDSSQSFDERREAESAIRNGSARLVFASPERLAVSEFRELIRGANVSTFAIDEAHCISHWGHDFRPEYRQLQLLKEVFPGASVHAYTATATEAVRNDISAQLSLDNPEVLVGNFDRPNLTYRVFARQDLTKQILEVLARHRNEAGIVYCIRRRDVDQITPQLRKHGVTAVAYHAGLSAEERHAAQEAFISERCDVVVATIAFGMGIDRSDVRFVVHAALPKSLEHYQQETGRAGRDGLEAECVLLYTGGDIALWRSMVENSASEETDPHFLENARKHLNEMSNYACNAVCRHKALVNYFGQEYEQEACSACDICLGDATFVDGAEVVAKKILSCVARLKGRFGVGHVVSVLRGENVEAVRRFDHDQLSTFGIMKEHDKQIVRNWIYQLIGQELLLQQDIEVAGGRKIPILTLNQSSWEVMRDERPVRLLQPAVKEKRSRRSKADTQSWEGVDRDLFEVLRGVRRELASERRCPPYIIFSDATLRELARIKPASVPEMLDVHGIGSTKANDFGERFLDAIRAFQAS